MSKMMKTARSKRVTLILLLIAGMAAWFWSQSRVPALNEKAEMGEELQLEDSLSFDVIYVVDRAHPLWKKVTFTTINWAYTNKKGMMFGIAFGGALMTIFMLLKRRSFKNRFLNSGAGTLIGAPLGVCVNCATPIAQGAYYAGARLEMSLATLMSSPTLNVIVLTMLFSLFPPYMVVIKLGLTVGFLLVGIPLLVRWFDASGSRFKVPDPETCDLNAASVCQIDLDAMTDDADESWFRSIWWAFKNYFKNLGWVLIRTVPLMLLAGLLGSLVIHVIPWELLVNLFENRGGRIYDLIGQFGVVLIGLTIVAAVGIMLPVPMTFDLIIVATLLGAGMPVHYAMVLLFTLGIFSVYPLTMIWKDVSPRVAFTIAGVLAILGVFGGFAAYEWDRRDNAKRSALLLQAFGAEAPESERPERVRPDVMPGEELAATLASQQIPAEPVGDVEALSIERLDFRPSVGTGETIFRKVAGKDFGLEEPYRFTVESMLRPYEFHAPIAAGDIHNDGWMDVAFASMNDGVSLYANVEGKFVRQELDLPGLPDALVGQVAFVDLNDDGWLDLFVTTYRHGNYVVYNDSGEFHNDQLTRIANPNDDKNLTTGASFGDLDHDGDLDIAVGNWARWNHRAAAQNVILFDEGDSYRIEPMENEIHGSTWSMLFTDWNVDGKLDLISGHDGPPTMLYEGDGTGALTSVRRDENRVPHTPVRTMTVATGDINNDLVPEVYLGQITGFSTMTDRIEKKFPEDLCNELPEELREECLRDTAVYQRIRRSVRARDVRQCLELDDPIDRDFCLALHALNNAMWNRDSSYCEMLPERWDDLRLQCDMFFLDHLPGAEERRAEAPPQVLNLNVLLVPNDEGGFDDLAPEHGVEIAGWTWNAKFADLNNDEWVDLYAVNGVFESKMRESCYLFLNRGGSGFDDVTIDSGIMDYFPTSAYTYVDFDNDGDLDIVAAPIHGIIWVFENQTQNKNAIAFELRDFQGNRFGIGSKVIIHYGDENDERHQMREIQGGGGFISWDPMVAHFGLGDLDSVRRVEIHWSTGDRTELDMEFEAGATYRITRPAQALTRRGVAP